MNGNQGNYKTYRAEQVGRHITVESQRKRGISVNVGFQSVVPLLRPDGARSLGEALIRAADNAEGRKVA